MSDQAAADLGCLGLRWSAALLDGLAGAGVTTLVMSPGSRSTPVVLAAQRRPTIDIVPILDERSAAFFALGSARASGRPVALLATSGSAPAHWYPAVIEASESGIPLVLLSADRPPSLRNWGANQTIDQTRLFGAFVRETHDPGLPRADAGALKAMAALGLRAGTVASGPRPGPVHINLPFADALVPAGDCDSPPRAASPAMPSLEPTVRLDRLPRGRGVIVCGPGTPAGDFPDALLRCAARHALPVLADPLSGLRFGPAAGSVISGYDALLRNGAAARALRPDWVLRFGRAPVSKSLIGWLEGLPTLLVDAGGGWNDPTHDVVRRLDAAPAAVCEAAANLAADLAAGGPDAAWLEAWRTADRRIAALADRHLSETDWFEGHLIRRLMGLLSAGEALLCASSLPIRQLDTWSGVRGDALAVFCNRGVSGIDGQVSTLAGLCHGGRPAWGLLGDLSFCHDLSGLLQAGRLDRPLLVLNNGGGRIFDYLPQHGLPGLETLWRTPVAPAAGPLAAAFGLEHRMAEDAAGLESALSGRVHGGAGTLVEIRIDADASRTAHQRFWQLAADAPLVDAAP